MGGAKVLIKRSRDSGFTFLVVITVALRIASVTAMSSDSDLSLQLLDVQGALWCHTRMCKDLVRR